MPAPAVSVIIATTRASPVLADCISALQHSARSTPMEVVVADGSPPGGRSTPLAHGANLRLLRFEDQRSVPLLRGAAMAAATAKVVAVIDPYCIVTPDWVPSVVRLHHERAEPVIGGPVELDVFLANSSRWATYLFEYWEFTPPMEEGPVSVLSGNNLAYKRAALGTDTALERDGFWKAFVNARLLADGARFWLSPAMTVRLRKAVPFGEFLTSRFHHGRSYAAMRVNGRTTLSRVGRALTTPALPPLFLLRQARHLWSRPAIRGRFLGTLPLMSAMHLCWAFGEFAGYLLGAGDSHGRLDF